MFPSLVLGHASNGPIVPGVQPEDIDTVKLLHGSELYHRVCSSDNRLTGATDALGRTTTYTYDVAGQLTTRTPPAGGATSYAYDANGRLTAITDPLGNKGTAAYDAGGSETSSTDPRGVTTVFDGAETFDTAELFPVLNINKVLLSVMTSSAARASASALYMLDAESDAITKVAHTLRDFIEHLIEKLEAGYVNHTINGVMWTRGPFRFDPSMEPYGAPPTKQT